MPMWHNVGGHNVGGDDGGATGSDASSSQSASQQHEEDNALRRLRRWAERYEVHKYFFVAAVIAILVVLSEQVGSFLLQTRSALRAVPLWLGILTITTLSCPRRVVLPLYFIFPYSTVSLLYLVAKTGWVRAALIWQCITCLDSAWFFMIRYFWTPFVDAVVDPDDETSKRFVPNFFLRVLATLDREWAHRIRPMDLTSFASVVLLQVAWATDEQVTIYFLCTRCGLTWVFFTLAWTAGILVRIPEFFVRAIVIDKFVQNFNLGALPRAFKEVPLSVILLFAVLAVASTLLVHLVHAQLIIAWSRGDDDAFVYDDNDHRSASSSGGVTRRTTGTNNNKSADRQHQQQHDSSESSSQASSDGSTFGSFFALRSWKRRNQHGATLGSSLL